MPGKAEELRLLYEAWAKRVRSPSLERSDGDEEKKIKTQVRHLGECIPKIGFRQQGIDFVGKINFECVYSSHLAHYF